MKISGEAATGKKSLFSNQQEADSKVILSAICACQNEVDKTVVCSHNTDVLVQLLHYCKSIHAKEIFMLTGHQDKYADLTRYVPVHVIYQKLIKEQ